MIFIVAASADILPFFFRMLLRAGASRAYMRPVLLYFCCVRWCGLCLWSSRLRFLQWFGGCDVCVSGTETWNHSGQHVSFVPCAIQTFSAILPPVHLSGAVYCQCHLMLP